MRLTKSQFETGYCERSKITLGEYRLDYMALPCTCGAEGCPGWATVSQSGHSILLHCQLYVLSEETLQDMLSAEYAEYRGVGKGESI